MKRKITILGSGLSGLAAGIRLAANGHEVEIFEKGSQPGGRAAVYEINGYRFDGSPAFITAPYLLDELWSAAGKNRADDVRLDRIEPHYRVFDGQGGRLDLTGDDEGLLAQVDRLSPGDRPGVQAYQEYARAAIDWGFHGLATRPVGGMGGLLRNLPGALRLRAHRGLLEQTSGMIQDDFLRRALAFYPVLVGGNPATTPAVYALLHELMRQGVWYPQGAGSLVRAMTGLFERLGGKLHLGAEATELLVQNRLVTSVRLRDGSVHRADVMVSSLDLAATYQRLISARHRRLYTPQRIERFRYGPSLFILHLGTRRRYTDSGLLHHNFILAPGWKADLEGVFEQHTLPGGLSLYVGVPSLTDPTLAPEGGETLTVIVPVPNLDAPIDWNQRSRPLRDALLNHLEANYLPDLRASIVAEHHVNPLYLRDELGYFKGSPFSLQPLLTQSAWLRPRNRSEEFDNLYFVGAGTHPGAGLPGALCSARITADLIAARG